jgi:hypothetical protein
MVVIFGQPSEPCASLTHQYLRRPWTAVAFIDDFHLLMTAALSWFPGRSPHDSFLTVHASRNPPTDPSGVLVQGPMDIPPGRDVLAGNRQHVAAELAAALLVFLYSLPSRVIDRPVPGGRDLSCSAGRERPALACPIRWHQVLRDRRKGAKGCQMSHLSPPRR